MDEKVKQEVIEMIRKRLPDRAEILFLSLTGSRAFGWAAENQDYDVHGMFACENYWDWVHIGKHAYDTNLYELTHALFDIQYQHFTIFMNFSNPFFLHEKFDFEGMMSFCTLQAVKNKEGDIKTQINRFYYDKAARTALHAYRILMVPLHFIETRKFELNVFELNKKYSFTELEKLKQIYVTKRGQFNVEQVKKDLKYLYEEYKKKQPSCDEKVNMNKAKVWFNKMKNIFY